jgi:hypothetical protein
MAFSERLPTRLNPLAERTCFSQVHAPHHELARGLVTTYCPMPVKDLQCRVPKLVNSDARPRPATGATRCPSSGCSSTLAMRTPRDWSWGAQEMFTTVEI